MWELEKTRKILAKVIKNCPKTLVILGSGWNHALKLAKIETRVGYDKLFGIKTSVPGHSGELVVGEIEHKRVVFMSGRFHLYEGYTGQEATSPIAALLGMGVERVVVTSASGALNPRYKVGDFVVIDDLLTIFLRSNPLVGPKFLDMSQVFDPAWMELAKKEIRKLTLVPRSGVYAYMPGPHYESFADKKALKILGADCVGMSTVPEVLTAKAWGAKVLGLSLITNLAFVKHDHLEVMAAAKVAETQMGRLIGKVV